MDARANRFTGDAHHVLQAGEVHGGVHIHTAPEPAPGQVAVGPIPLCPRHFQHRDQVARLAEVDGTAVLYAVTGQRGIGKTQVAGAYARQRVADGWLVAWIPAETANSVTGGLLELADELGLRRPRDSTGSTLARLRNHLQTRSDPALLVFDNVTDPDTVRPHLPATGVTQIVLTSSFRSVERKGEPVPVDLFSIETAVRFLTEATGLDDEPGARALAEQLGCLPLALAQAAARIALIERDYATYSRRLTEISTAGYLTARPGDPYPKGTAEAILLAVKPFTSEGHSHELRSLALLSVLSPDGVPRDLLGTGIEFDNALEHLVDACLVANAGAGADTLVIMHRLTQRVVREHVDDLASLVDIAIEGLAAAAIPEDEAWQRRKRGDDLVRQVEALWEHGATSPLRPELFDVLQVLRDWSVRQLIQSASLDRAILLADTVLTDRRRALGGDHHSILRAINNLAVAHNRAGHLDMAIPLYEECLTSCHQLFGPDDTNTLTSINNLANAYCAAGFTEKAVHLSEQNEVDTRQMFGDTHLNTITATHNLANAYESAGRLDDAVHTHEANLTKARQVLGEEHISTIISADSLACAYQSTGRLDDSVKLLEQTLAKCRQVLGECHPLTVNSKNNLAYSYQTVGRTGEALLLSEENLANARSELGGRHPTTLDSIITLACLYHVTGRTDEAVTLVEEANALAQLARGEPAP